MTNKFQNLFSVEKPIIGMIHLSGDSKREKMLRALAEIERYQINGIDGAIIEDYHGSLNDVKDVLKETKNFSFKIILGINVLRDPYLAFNLADRYGAEFIQFDTIQEEYLDVCKFNSLKQEFPDVVVLGGVGFKYIPETGRTLDQELEEGKQRCDAIVTTGEGTGIETPLEKLKVYRSKLKDFPLIIGAGVTDQNIREQLQYADGAIIGSFFKKDYQT